MRATGMQPSGLRPARSCVSTGQPREDRRTTTPPVYLDASMRPSTSSAPRHGNGGSPTRAGRALPGRSRRGRSWSKLLNRGTNGFVCWGGALVEAQQHGLVLDRGERDQGVVGGTAEDLSGGYGGQKLLVSRF